jgi:hypothetical protein
LGLTSTTSNTSNALKSRPYHASLVDGKVQEVILPWLAIHTRS